MRRPKNITDEEWRKIQAEQRKKYRAKKAETVNVTETETPETETPETETPETETPETETPETETPETETPETETPETETPETETPETENVEVEELRKKLAEAETENKNLKAENKKLNLLYNRWLNAVDPFYKLGMITTYDNGTTARIRIPEDRLDDLRKAGVIVPPLRKV